MPTPTERQSLNKDLETRYKSQKAGGAFDVKKRLGAPGTPVGPTMPIDGNENVYTVDDFKTKMMQGVTELKEALEANTSSSPRSKQMSLYIKGFNNRKYKP